MECSKPILEFVKIINYNRSKVTGLNYGSTISLKEVKTIKNAKKSGGMPNSIAYSFSLASK